MRKLEEICKNCKYWQHEEIDNGFVCVNDLSYHLADWTEEYETCEKFEVKND